ncbi:MAG: asparagine synthase-related protein, partial [Planctomycetota bacterium]
ACDESSYAREAARHLGLPLVEVPVTPERCRDALPHVVAALEEPVAGPGALAQWVVAGEASRRVRILMGGCGGDELFSGYARAVALVRDRPPPALRGYSSLIDRVRGLPPPRRALALLDRRAPGLFHGDFLAAHPAPEQALLAAFAKDGLEAPAAAARAELRITLPALLQVEDRTTMAFGVEGRVPLLDRRLLRAATRLAAADRVDADGVPKALLRRAAAPHLPTAVAERRDKMGFPLPLGDWLRGPWRDLAGDVFFDRRTRERGMLDPDALRSALQRPDRYDRGLYAALCLELWCRTFLDG